MRYRWAFGIGLVTFTLGLLLHWQRTRLYAAYGQWLTSAQPLTPTWEAIFVLSGKPLERALKASEMWALRPAPIYLTGGLRIDNLVAGGCKAYTECEITAHILEEYCIPANALNYICEGTSTYDEILLIRQLCQKKGYKRILIVSSAFHGRRIQLLTEKYLIPVGISMQFAPAQPLHFRLEAWWQSEYGLLTAFEESVKILFYWRSGLV